MTDPYNLSTGDPTSLYGTNTSSTGGSVANNGDTSWIGQLVGGALGAPGSQDALVNAATISGLAAAGKQLSDSYKYPQLGEYAAQVSNPFGPSRQTYINKLNQSWTDPTAFPNDPAHRGIQERQMAAIGAKNSASGYAGSGLNQTQLADYLATSDNQYLQQERQALAQLAGSQFNPASAGAYIMQGGQLGLQSSDNAVGSLLAPLTAYAGGNRNQTTINNNAGGSSGVSPNGGANGTGTNFTGKSLPAGAVVTGATDAWGNKIVMGPNGQQLGIIGQDGSFYNSNPGVDFGGSSNQGNITGVLDPNTGLPWGVDPSSMYIDPSWTNGYDVGNIDLSGLYNMP